MNEQPASRQPVWPSLALVAVLGAQVCLLWLHGGMLNRQHGDIQAMRQDIQELTESLDNNTMDQGSVPEEGSYKPAGHRHSRRSARLQQVHHVVLQDNQDNAPEKQDPTMKETQEARDSAKKAIADARDIRQKLSIEENVRKADEKKKVEAATSSITPLVYWAMGIALLAFIVGRVWRARAGGR